MNGIFLTIFLLCSVYFLIFNPEAFLPTLLGGAQKAATLCLSLIVIYSVWTGLLQVMEQSGLNKKISRVLRPLVSMLFHAQDKTAVEYISLNLSANMLGISGAATPFGIRAAERLETLPNAKYNHAMLFALNATSVQILPTTVLALLLSYGATNAYSIILPSLLASAVSTVLSVVLVKLLIQKDGT